MHRNAPLTPEGRFRLAAELVGDFVHTARTATDLEGRPLGGAGGENLAGSCDAAVLFGPRALRAVRVRAHEAALVPHEARRPTEHGEVNDFDARAVLLPGEDPTARAPHRRSLRLDMDPCLAVVAVPAAEEPHGRKSDHPLDRARRVSLHGGPSTEVVEQLQSCGPPLRDRGPSDYLYFRACTPFISEVPVTFAPLAAESPHSGITSLAPYDPRNSGFRDRVEYSLAAKHSTIAAT